jgi:hypothetical protein
MENNLLHGAPLYYPSAKEWMWTYCIYLGPYTDSRGKNYDLGIHINHDSFLEYSNATVYGDEPGNYSSGVIYPMIDFDNEISQEVVRRAKLLNLLPTVVNPGDPDYPVAL